MPGDFSVTVKGLVEWQRALKTLQQPQLGQVVGLAMKDSMQSELVPAIKRQLASDARGQGDRSRPAKRGRGGPLARNVTVRRASKRGRRDRNEMVAYNAAPRAWYRHFFIQGTERHSLAKGAKRRSGLKQNVPPIHPGARDHNSVERAVTGKQAIVAKRMGEAVMFRYRKAVGK